MTKCGDAKAFQKFSSVHAYIQSHINLERHLISCGNFKQN